MKTVRLLIAAALALAALLGVVLALTWGQPATARAEDALSAPAAPQTLPSPWLSDDDVVDAPYNWWSPTVDGRIDPGEYAGAGKVTFPGYAGDVEVFIKQDAITLYIAFDSPDTTPYPYPSGGGLGPAFQIFLDTNDDKASAPQPDDYRLTVDKGGNLMENQGTGTGWGGPGPGNWTAAVYATTWGWQSEFAISFSKLGITQTGPISIGLGLAEVWTPSWPHDWYWPSGGDWLQPNTWGYLVSSSDWDTFYWKPGPWEDYAPSGMPDFDQMQVGPTYCGPFAAANSLWWFDSKFETPDHPPPGISDTYRLVWSYGPWDDHDPQNVSPLANDLAWYFDTDGIRTGGGWLGTYITDMHSGTLAYLRDHGLWDDYLVTLVEQPEFDWIADEVQRCEDVILLLGFWEEQPPGSGNWVRIGGHYVTVAGVEPGAWQIAFSDPAVDNAEQPGPGRVLSGTLIPHIPIPGHPVTTHNDAGNVSHDIHVVLPDSPSPGGTWWIPEYEVPPIFFEIPGLNPNPRWPEPGFYQEGYIHTEIEFALSVSPFTWKSSGEWVPEGEDPIWGYWLPWQDYAPNGVPDFDEKQDCWGIGGGPCPPDPPAQYTFCGPAAAANSLWWFDSKFEPNPIPPPTINDTYPLVQSYNPGGWDDHDPLNVDDPTTPWPPGGEFVEDLAWYFDTDGQRTGSVHAGTIITDLYTGTVQYITDHGLRQGYVITMVESPEFWWVAEEVEVCEDVIILLGFWEEVGIEGWKRIGGHYLTLPGIDKQGGLVAFSDPFYDGAEYAWPYAYPTGWPTVMGRVADGWLIPHPPWGHASDVHNDAGNISHDVYYVVGTDSPGGGWGPWGYVESGYVEENFLGQNGDSEPYTGGKVQAEVEWAVTVSPVADVEITKTVVPTVVVPGGWVTFTITFGNGGSLPAENVVISDVLPSGLVSPSVVGTWNNYGGAIVTYDTFTWTVGSIPWQGWGIITVTAQVSPTASGIITNTAEIATSSVEQYQEPPLPNVASAYLIVQAVQKADVVITKTVQPASVVPGDLVTYTLTYANNGPAAAANTRVTDSLPSELTGDVYTYSNDYGATITHTGRYVWDVADVPAGRGGVITVTAQVSPGLTSAGTILNQAAIDTTTPESDYTNNDSSDSQNLCIPPSGATFAYAPPAPVVNQTVTFTGSVTLGDPTPAYTWDFGDTNTGSGSPVANIYNSAGTYTVRMTATNTCGQAVYSETLSVCEPVGVELTPPTAQQDGHPGDVMTYTLTVRNTGERSDTYALNKAGNVWNTSLPASVGPLAPSATARFNVTVQIPGGASGGDQDVVTITAVSQHDATKQDSSVLTTTAITPTQPITRGVTLTAAVTAREGTIGTRVTYTLRLTNTGSAADFFNLTWLGNAWLVDLSAYGLSLGAGQGTDVLAYVWVPLTASDGATDTVTIKATSANDATATDDVALTTTARWHRIYLPLVTRNHP